MTGDKKLEIRSRRDGIAVFLASGFGSGLLPSAPGTWGTVVALAIVHLLSRTALPALPTIAGLVVVSTVLCLLLGRTIERVTGDKDPQIFVMDEFAGFFVAVLLPGNVWPTPRELLVAFLLFRLFDIIKPPPARRLQALPSGLGIVIDDLIAGFYAWVGVAVVHDLHLHPL